MSTLLNIGYLLPIPFRAFFRPPAQPVQGMREAPAWCLVAIGITCIGCVVLFVAPDPIVDLLQSALSSAGTVP